MPYIRAEAKNGKIYYNDENGKIEIRSDGSRAWRNNNPGNTKGAQGAIGRDGGHFDIFPDHETGRKAKKNIVMNKYGNYNSIREMLKGKFDGKGKFIKGSAYAPESDKNNPDEYADQIKEWTGLDVDNKKINSLTEEEKEKLLNAIARKEGSKKGHIEIIDSTNIKPAGPNKKANLTEPSVGNMSVYTNNEIEKIISNRWIRQQNTDYYSIMYRWDGKF